MTPTDLIKQARALAETSGPGRRVVLALCDALERSEEDRVLNGRIITKVNDAVNRAGIHCAVYYWEAIDMIAAERDALRGEVEQLTKELDTYADAIMSGPIAAQIINRHVIEYNDRQSDALCAANSTIAELRAEVERLRKERDEVRAAKVPPSVDELLGARMQAAVAKTERDAALARVSQLEAELGEARRGK